MAWKGSLKEKERGKKPFEPLAVGLYSCASSLFVFWKARLGVGGVENAHLHLQICVCIKRKCVSVFLSLSIYIRISVHAFFYL